MRVVLWDRSIEIRQGSNDHFACVNNSRDALRLLMTDWPVKGKSFAAARAACMKSIDGDVEMATAIEAFESAAREADMLR